LKMVTRMFPLTGPQTHATIDFLYSDDIELSKQASVRFLTLERIVGDYLYNCGQEFTPKYQYNEHQSSLENEQQMFRYKFSWQPSRDRWPRWSGVKQGDEIQFIFGDPLDHPADYLIEEKEFSKQMMTYWANFARTGSPNNQTAPSWPESVEEDLVMELNAIRSDVTEIGIIQKQRCRFWNNLLPRLQDISVYQCKANKWNKRKEKPKDFDQKYSEITTNQIEKISPSHSKSSTLMVDEPHSTTRRTLRGLNLKIPKGRQFIYKVKTLIPQDEQVRSTVKVLERSRPKKLFKRQLKLKNNTQISYKLNVDLENDPESQEPWAVYDTKVKGNSPIYIAPNKYQVDNQNPILNDDNLEDYLENPLAEVNNKRETGISAKKKNLQESTRSTQANPEESSKSRSSYDPFYPNFDGFQPKKSFSRSGGEAAVVLLDEQDSRPYFPNYFPKKDSSI